MKREETGESGGGLPSFSFSHPAKFSRVFFFRVFPTIDDL